MSQIRRLPPEVANRIAAGEVVERPASLVKELVENSIDAGATQIEVAVEGGGIDMIRVSDNGRGIPSAEVELAFERHATSKVWDPKDLVAIDTLGFRGEALASIAAVSRVELLSATADEPSATRLAIDAGEVVAKEAAARARGTSIEVRALFYNTPARRKFLRTPATEGRVLVRTLGQLALGAPGIGFQVTRDGKVVLDIAPTSDFRERTRALFGPQKVARMVPVDASRDGVRVTGLVSASDFTRTRANHQVLLANGRPIVEASLSHAVTAGIGGAVPGGKYPIFALTIEVDPSTLDVNVHPTKREVRFTRRDLVFSVIREAVQTAVFNTTFDELGRVGELPWSDTRLKGVPVSESRSGRRPPRFGPARESGGQGTAAPPPRGAHEKQGRSGEEVSPSQDPSRRDSVSDLGDLRPSEVAVPEQLESGALETAQLKLVGEIWGAYLLVEDRDRLLVIDQHAAHERVLYDEIRDGVVSGKKLPIQGLLIPLSIDLAPGQDSEAVAERLREMSFDARPGGPNTLLVDGIPGTLSRWGGGEFLQELFASPEGALKSAEKFRDALAKSYACKGAVKFNQRLHPDEIDHLLRGLERTDVPRLCPHGRPVYMEVAKHTVDARFER